jgi:hypothetical protein
LRKVENNMAQYPKFKPNFNTRFDDNALDDPSSPYYGKPSSAGEMISGAPGVEAPLGGTPRNRVISRNAVGYALGRAAQGVMGEFKESPAALLGGLGAELNQDQAFRQTTRRLLAGETLDDIDESSILSPEQLTVAVKTSEEGVTGRHKRQMERLDYENRLYEFGKTHGLGEAELKSRMEQYDKTHGLAERKFAAEEGRARTPEQLAEIERGNIEARGKVEAGLVGLREKSAIRVVEAQKKIDAGEELSDLDWIQMVGDFARTAPPDTEDPLKYAEEKINAIRKVRGLRTLSDTGAIGTTPSTKGRLVPNGRGGFEYRSNFGGTPKG